MSSFGEMLRKYRQNSKDPDSARQLSQERLGELLGQELGMFGGYSGAAVSDWERWKSKIHADDRRMLLGLIHLLYKHGGLKTISEADELLQAGNYRALSLDEKRQIFPQAVIDAQANPPVPGKRQGLIEYLLERVFYGNEDLQARFAKAEEGPPPSWPRKVVALTNKLTDGWSVDQSLRFAGWIWVWLLSSWLIIPSLRWPFIDREQALVAMTLYAAGALSIPLLIGLLTDTGNNPFWREQPLAAGRMIRLYTHQGAGIGFHLGYVAIFVINLAGYYLGSYLSLPSNPLLRVLFEGIAITFPLIMGYTGARLIPYNLWKAYKRLTLADGGIFFVFLLFGPFWGLFFYFYYPVLLDPVIGLLMITLLVLMLAGQYRRTGTTDMPVDWMFLIAGFACVLYQITITKNAFSVVALASFVIIFSTLLAPKRMDYTLQGMIKLLIASLLVAIVLWLNPWAGRIIVGIGLLVWRWQGKKYLLFPPYFWGFYLALGECTWLRGQQWLSDLQASIVLGVITLLLLLWERRSRINPSS